MTNNHTVKLKDGRKLGYSEYGDPKGKSLFYFHGWPVSRLSGKITDEAAKKLHIRVISPDRPGYGLSDFKKNRTLLEFPDDIVELADILGIKKFAVLGQSGGGPYAAVCAYKIPHKLTNVGIVVGLGPTWIPGALDGMAWTSKIGWANYARLPMTATAGAYLNYLIAKYIPSLGIFRFMFGAKSDRQINFKRTFRSSLQENFKEAFRQGHKAAEQDLILYTKDWGFSLKDIKVPVYLWYGEDDRNVSLNMGKYYHSQIKNSKLKVYPNEGHLIPRTHIEETLNTLIT